MSLDVPDSCRTPSRVLFISYILRKEPASMRNCCGFCIGEKCDILVQRFVVHFSIIYSDLPEENLNI